MAIVNIDRYVAAPEHPCPVCREASKAHNGPPGSMICTNNQKNGGKRHVWNTNDLG